MDLGDHAMVAVVLTSFTFIVLLALATNSYGR